MEIPNNINTGLRIAHKKTYYSLHGLLTTLVYTFNFPNNKIFIQIVKISGCTICHGTFFEYLVS